MKPAFRFPLSWLTIGWAVTIFLGSLFFLLTAYFSPSLGYVINRYAFVELLFKATCAAFPVLLISSGIIVLLNRRSLRFAGHAVTLLAIQLLFGFTAAYVHAYAPFLSTGYPFYPGVAIIEEMGVIMPLAAHCFAGWLVFGILLVILGRKQFVRRNEDVIDRP